ncbi:hypothetical protein ACFSNO_22815 [Streptomyces cirratus]
MSLPRLDLTTIRMGGIALEAPADSIPRHRIVQAQSSAVARSRGGDGTDSEYHDAGQPLTPPTRSSTAPSGRTDSCTAPTRSPTRSVPGWSSASRSTGGISPTSPTSPRTRSCWLRSARRTWCCEEGGAYGDFTGHGLYYWDARKHVKWDASGNRVTLINVGDFEGNAGP